MGSAETTHGTPEDVLDKLRAVVEARMPGCQRVQSIRPLTGGASRQMYKARVRTADGEQRLALRMTTSGALGSLQQLELPLEVTVLRAVRDKGVAAPEVYFEFGPQDGLGPGYAMEFVDGETLGGRIAKSARFATARQGLAAACGRTLAKIHRVDLRASGLAERMPAFTPISAIEQTYEQYLSLEASEPMLDYAARWLREHAPEPAAPVLTHGDFRNGNLVVDERGLAAILDWELSALGDPMRDLGWLCLNSWRYGVSHLPVGGFGTVEETLAAYTAAGGPTVDRERIHFWQVYGSFWWAVACMSMASTYRTGLARHADRPAIGRRTSEAQIDLVNLLIPGPIALPTGIDVDQERPYASKSELLRSARDDLAAHVTTQLDGKPLFVARVALSNLDVVLRELELGGATAARERDTAAALMERPFEDVHAARRHICRQLRDGALSLDDDALTTHLRESVAAQVAIDQPSYSGFQDAMKGRHHDP